MSPAGFLLLALGVSVLGSLLLWARTHRPGGIDSSIDDFRRELAALSPERSPDAVVREQSRLRAEGRWIERPVPDGPATGGDAPSVVVHGAHDLDDPAGWDELAAGGMGDTWDEHVADEDLGSGGWDVVGSVADHDVDHLDDADGAEVGGYFDDLYPEDEER